MELREIDTTDVAQLRAWWEVGAAANAERPGDPWPAWEGSPTALATPSPERDQTLVCVWDGDEAVGATMYLLPVNDNPHVAFADVFVRPERRREGIGRMLVADVEERTRAAGRTTILIETTTAPNQESAGSRFGTALGYAVANREEIKCIDLVEAQGRWPDLVAELAAHLGDYRIVTWDTVAPDEHVAGFGRLLSGFMSQIPLGDVALEDSEWTVDRLRTTERRMLELRRYMLTAVAVAPDGTLAGCSDVRVNHDAPESADVGITLVTEEHRGHRLGLALKLATHQMLLDAYPACSRATTSNATVNQHMATVNERLGYRVIEDLLELQKVLEG